MTQFTAQVVIIIVHVTIPHTYLLLFFYFCKQFSYFLPPPTTTQKFFLLYVPAIFFFNHFIIIFCFHPVPFHFSHSILLQIKLYPPPCTHPIGMCQPTLTHSLPQHSISFYLYHHHHHHHHSTTCSTRPRSNPSTFSFCLRPLSYSIYPINHLPITSNTTTTCTVSIYLSIYLITVGWCRFYNKNIFPKKKKKKIPFPLVLQILIHFTPLLCFTTLVFFPRPSVSHPLAYTCRSFACISCYHIIMNVYDTFMTI